MRLWLGLGAVADQAAFALANMAVHVLLARWLSEAEYGAFAGASTLPLLAGVAHAALFIEPLLVFGAVRYAGVFDAYLRIVLRLQWRFGAVVGLLLGAGALGAWWTDASSIGIALGGLAVATPPTLTCWCVRRACYAVERPDLAAVAGALQLVLVVGGLAGLAAWGAVGVGTAALLTGAASFAAGTVARWRLVAHVQRRPASPADPGEVDHIVRAGAGGGMDPDAREVWRAHVAIGRWGVAAGALSWVQGYLFYLVLPLWAGLEATGALRALVTVVMPVLQADSALVTACVPSYVRAAADGRLGAVVRRSLALFWTENAAYWLVLAVAHRPLVMWLYAGRFVDTAPLLLALGALPLCASGFNVWASALRARGDAAAVLRGTVAAVGVAGTAGLWAMHTWGLAGAVGGLVLAAATQAGVVGFAFRRVPCRAPLASPHVVPEVA